MVLISQHFKGQNSFLPTNAPLLNIWNVKIYVKISFIRSLRMVRMDRNT